MLSKKLLYDYQEYFFQGPGAMCQLTLDLKSFPIMIFS